MREPITPADINQIKTHVHRQLKTRRALASDEEAIVQEAAILLWRSKKPRSEVSFVLLAGCAVSTHDASSQARGGLAGATGAVRRAHALHRYASSHGLDPDAPATREAYNAAVAARRADPARQGAKLRDEVVPTCAPTERAKLVKIPAEYPGVEDRIVETDAARDRLAGLRGQLSPQAQAVLDAWLRAESKVLSAHKPQNGAPWGALLRATSITKSQLHEALTEIYQVARTTSAAGAALIQGEEMVA